MSGDAISRRRPARAQDPCRHSDVAGTARFDAGLAGCEL